MVELSARESEGDGFVMREGGITSDCDAWSRLLERIHRPAFDDDTWAEPILNAWSALLPKANNIGLQVLENQSLGSSVGRVVAYETGFCVIAHPAPGVVILLYALQTEQLTLTPHEARLLTRLAMHLENAQRAYRCAAMVRAVIGGDGTIVQQTEDPLELWRWLVHGRVSLVPHPSDRGSHLVLDVPQALRPSRALTETEERVVALAAGGVSPSFIANEMSLPPMEVLEILAEVAAKVGVTSRADLVRIAGLALRSARTEPPIPASADDADEPPLADSTRRTTRSGTMARPR